VIFVAVGHNKDSQGASYKAVTEFILAEKWADLIAEILGNKCLRVPNGRLGEKVDFINGIKPDKCIAIEIHFNSYKKWNDLNGNGIIDAGEMISLGRGSETLYHPKSVTGKRAATIMQEHLCPVFKPNRGIKEGYYQLNPAKGVDYFLAKTNCTALIIEPEFIDNITEINQGMKEGCYAIANALIEMEDVIFEGLHI